MRDHLYGLLSDDSQSLIDLNNYAAPTNLMPDSISPPNNISNYQRKASIRGVAVSCGTVQSICTVVRRPEDLWKVLPGSILVCPYLSCDYLIEYLPIVGVISQTGGTLSIAASIARKKHLPTVTGIDHIVEVVWDGDYIRIDGTEGYVHFISSGSL